MPSVPWANPSSQSSVEEASAGEKRARPTSSGGKLLVLGAPAVQTSRK